MMHKYFICRRHLALGKFFFLEFQSPLIPLSSSLQRVPRTKKTSVPSFGTYISREWETSTPIRNLRRKMSDPDIHHYATNILAGCLSQNSSPNTSESLSINQKSERSIGAGLVGGNTSGSNNTGSILRTGRALINPFDPSHVTIKLTSNRRRWTHIFPKVFNLLSDGLKRFLLI
jgi:DEP domain-containing protein 5